MYFRKTVLTLQSKRFCSLLSTPKQQEISIPVPWGKIAAKQWGNPNGLPVLCIHGWLDNSCSFDGLAPLLPNDSHNFLAIDIQGHGLSDHYPAGMNYRFSDALTAVKYIKEHMNWDKFSIIGHSMGAAIAIWYSSIFHDDVQRLVSLDLVNVAPLKLEKHFKQTRKSINSSVSTFKTLSGRSVPKYDFIDAVARAYMANQFAHGEDSITQKSVEILMKRGLRKLDNDKYTWNADLRLRVPASFHVLEEQVVHYASKIQCPMMLIKASGSHWYMDKEIAKRIIKTYLNHNPNFIMHKVIGGHHIHLNQPESVSELITEFLTRPDSEFREIDPEKADKQENFPLDLF